MGESDPNSAANKKVQMLESFCRVSAFDEIITRDTGMLYDSSIIRVIMADSVNNFVIDQVVYSAFQIMEHSIRSSVKALDSRD